MLLLRAKAGETHSSVKGNTLKIDRSISGTPEESVPMLGRRLNGKQKGNYSYCRITGKQAPVSGKVPADRVAHIVQSVKDRAEDEKHKILETGGRIIEEMEAEHARQQMAMSDLANRHVSDLVDTIKRKDHDFEVVNAMHNKAVDKVNMLATKLARMKDLKKQK